MTSIVVADRIMKINKLLNDNDGMRKDGTPMHIILSEAFESMGSGCLFDDFVLEAEARGALKVFDWIINHLEYKGE